MLGLDALGSAAYGPEAALTLLIPLGAAGIGYIGPISTLIILLLLIVYVSYRRRSRPTRSGAARITVAKENLGINVGLIAAAALLLDYVLVVAVGISAGIGALVSALRGSSLIPSRSAWRRLALITIVNLAESRVGPAFLAPTYLFIGTLLAVLAIGIVKSIASGGRPVPVSPLRSRRRPKASASFWILMRFVRQRLHGDDGRRGGQQRRRRLQGAVGRPCQADPHRHHRPAGVMLAGIAYLCHAYGIGATEPGRPGFESVLSQLVAAVVGRGAFYYLTIGSVLVVLALSANTGFADFPRLCRVVAQDGYLPNAFAHRGRRLVYSQGIVVLAVLSAGLLIAFGGITDRLIPLFAVGAFLAFTMSQAGMVGHWRKEEVAMPASRWRSRRGARPVRR